MKFFVLALTVCLAGANFSSHEDEEEQTTSTSLFDPPLTPEAEQCIKYNQHRHDLIDCCDYPRVNFFQIFATRCIDECVGSKDVCCGMLCVWRNTKVTFHDGVVNLDGLKKTLLDSVAHKDDWEHLVSKAVDQCDSEVKQEEMDRTCKIPTHLSGLVNCAIKKLFLMCPNMHKSPRCETTRKYVDECL